MSVREKPYYSIRMGKNPTAVLDLANLCWMFLVVYRHLRSSGYFDEAFGLYCVDSGPAPGALGEDIDGVLLLELRKSGLWPIEEKIESYSEDDLFDIAEFLFDHVSKPIDGHYHSYADCGCTGRPSTVNRDRPSSERR